MRKAIIKNQINTNTLIKSKTAEDMIENIRRVIDQGPIHLLAIVAMKEEEEDIEIDNITKRKDTQI